VELLVPIEIVRQGAAEADLHSTVISVDGTSSDSHLSRFPFSLEPKK
jgi:hypothetical protein